MRRFSKRVSDYVKYRPCYPTGVVFHLEKQYGITSQFIIADIGAGTGISSNLFLDNGYRVIAVEPNKEMRNAAIEKLKPFEKFSYTSGTAENTLLPDNSVDVIIVAQAFHWFDAAVVKKEFQRILKPGGIVVLIWNSRLVVSNFDKELEELIFSFSIDYVEVGKRNIDDKNIYNFFEPNICKLKIIPNHQDLDLEGLVGRIKSSSYMPLPDNERYDEMIEQIEKVFDKYKENGHIRISYDTKIYSGILKI
jgi:ubiquinone/menaquinone biosynthesis C-methylase UbiE